MASVNSSALNILKMDHAEEACRIIDAIGFVSNDLGTMDEAMKLNQLRTDLKRLFSKINDDRYPVIS